MTDRQHPALELRARVPVGADVVISVGHRRGERGKVVEQLTPPDSKTAITGACRYVVELPPSRFEELRAISLRTGAFGDDELAALPRERCDYQRWEFKRITARMVADAERAGRAISPGRRGA